MWPKTTASVQCHVAQGYVNLDQVLVRAYKISESTVQMYSLLGG